MRLLLTMLTLMMSTLAVAQDTSGVPQAAPEFFSAAYLGQVVLSLLVVVGLMFAMLWALRRFNGAARGSSAQMQVLASIGLGQREKAVLLNVGSQQLLLGVSPGTVRTLHVFDDPVVDLNAMASEPAEPPAFAEVWKHAMGKRGEG